MFFVASECVMAAALSWMADAAVVRSSEATTASLPELPAARSFQPQHSASLVAGVVGQSRGRFWQQTDLALGLKYEVLWARRTNRQVGFGPFVETRTAGFAYGDFGGGLVLVLPVFEAMPLWLNASGFARFEDNWRPGAALAATWGVRSVNFHSSYGMAFGLTTEARVTDRGVDWTLGGSVDLAALALPFVILGGALR